MKAKDIFGLILACSTTSFLAGFIFATTRIDRIAVFGIAVGYIGIAAALLVPAMILQVAEKMLEKLEGIEKSSKATKDYLKNLAFSSQSGGNGGATPPPRASSTADGRRVYEIQP